MVRTQEQFEQIQAVKKSINTASEAVKNQALLAMADHLLAATEEILEANALDMAAAKGKISDVMLDRLYLDEGRIEAMARGIREVVALPDPIGEVLEISQLENGLLITKKRVAMGVIGIIYESRPNVTSDAAALALKSGNAVVLRSGKDAYQTAHAIVTALKKGLETTAIHPNVIQLVVLKKVLRSLRCSRWTPMTLTSTIQVLMGIIGAKNISITYSRLPSTNETLHWGQMTISSFSVPVS